MTVVRLGPVHTAPAVPEHVRMAREMRAAARELERDAAVARHAGDALAAHDAIASANVLRRKAWALHPSTDGEPQGALPSPYVR